MHARHGLLTGIAAFSEIHGSIQHARLGGEVLGGHVLAEAWDAGLDARCLVGVALGGYGPVAQQVFPCR